MRFYSYFRKNKAYGGRGGTTKVTELEAELRNNGFVREQSEHNWSEYAYVWKKEGMPNVNVNYRYGPSGESYAYILE